MKHALVTGVLALALLPLAGLRPAQDGVACENVIRHEPLLHYELSGYTIAAMVDRSLTVWADGSLRLAEANASGTGRCLLAQTTPEEAQALHRELTGAGAFASCDEALQVTDMPLSTLTIFRGTQDARAHSFSWWLPQGEYAAYDEMLEKFITHYFAGM